MTTGITQPGIREVPPVEILDGHRSRRRVIDGIYPRADVRILPTRRRVSIRLPSGVAVKVYVKLRVSDGYVVANVQGHERLCGENEDASAAFPLSAELEAERIALEAI